MQLRYLNHAVEALLTPVGLTVVFALIVVLVCSFFTRRAALGLCTILLAVSGFSTGKVELWYPFQQLANNARSLVVFLLVITALTLLSHVRLRAISFGICGWAFYMVCLASDMILAGLYEKGVTNLFVTVAIFFIFGMGINGFLDSPDMAKKVLNIHLGALIGILICCQIQLVIDRSAIATGRLFGISGNPQGCGWILAIGSIGVLARWFITPFRNALSKFFFVGMGLYVLLLLLWTGSRMSWLIAIAGSVVFFRRRLGVLLLGFLPILIFTLAFIFAVPESDGGGSMTAMDSEEGEEGIVGSAARTATSRSLTMDTRTGIIHRLWGEFAESPIVGQKNHMAWGENSYLSILASMGLIGGVVMGLAFLGGVVDLLKVHSRRGLLCREDQVMFDYVAACLAAMAVAGMFDGVMLGFTIFWGIFPFVPLVLLNYLVRRVNEAVIPVQLVGIGEKQAIYRAAEDAFGGVRRRVN